MFNYIVRKLMMLVPMLLIVSFLIFGGVELMPGDAIDFLVPPDALANINPADLEALREAHGLNDPFIMRYFRWLGGVVQGDFGFSMESGVPVSTLMANHLPATLELSFVALVLSTILGSIFGVISALKKGSIGDNVLSVAGMVGLAVPQFVFGLLMIILFTFTLDWLPVGGRFADASQSFFQRIEYLIMPALVLGLSLTAGVMRYSRASMLDSLNKEYIKTARSKGLSEWRVNLIHGLRVALSPVVVLIGFRLPILIGGAVVIEQVFQWPGIGQLFVTAVNSQDTSIIMMVGFFTVLMVLLASMIVDVATALLDPRVKLS